MDDTDGVDGFERVAEPDGQRADELRSQRSVASQALGERFAGDGLHDEDRTRGGLDHVEEADDSGMLDARERARLPQGALQVLGVGRRGSLRTRAADLDLALEEPVARTDDLLGLGASENLEDLEAIGEGNAGHASAWAGSGLSSGSHAGPFEGEFGPEIAAGPGRALREPLRPRPRRGCWPGHPAPPRNRSPRTGAAGGGSTIRQTC